jgi:hypothetical protein
MVFSFFDNKWTVYTHYVPRVTAANADYLAGALRKFLKAHHQKWPDLVNVERVFPLGRCPSSHRLKGAGIPVPKKSLSWFTTLFYPLTFSQLTNVVGRNCTAHVLV